MIFLYFVFLFLSFLFFYNIKSLNISKKVDCKNFSNYKLSIIIPAKNEENSLPLLLKSLNSQSEFIFEIIVANDSSSDKTAEIAKCFNVNLINVTRPNRLER